MSGYVVAAVLTLLSIGVLYVIRVLHADTLFMLRTGRDFSERPHRWRLWRRA